MLKKDKKHNHHYLYSHHQHNFPRRLKIHFKYNVRIEGNACKNKNNNIDKKIAERSAGLFCSCGMKAMWGMPTLIPRGPRWLASGPRQSSRTEAVPTCRPPPLHPCRPPLLALLCNSRGRPAARQREAFMPGHKAHQIQLCWKGWAAFPAPRVYSHALNLAVILLPPVFSLWWLFFVSFGAVGGGEGQTCHRLICRHFLPPQTTRPRLLSPVLPTPPPPWVSCVLIFEPYNMFVFGYFCFLPAATYESSKPPFLAGIATTTCHTSIPSGWPAWDIAAATVGCWSVFLFSKECCLNRTCQTLHSNLQLRDTIVFFFLPFHVSAQFSFKKRENGP